MSSTVLAVVSVSGSAKSLAILTYPLRFESEPLLSSFFSPFTKLPTLTPFIAQTEKPFTKSFSTLMAFSNFEWVWFASAFASIVSARETGSLPVFGVYFRSGTVTSFCTSSVGMVTLFVTVRLSVVVVPETVRSFSIFVLPFTVRAVLSLFSGSSATVNFGTSSSSPLMRVLSIFSLVRGPMSATPATSSCLSAAQILLMPTCLILSVVFRSSTEAKSGQSILSQCSLPLTLAA